MSLLQWEKVARLSVAKKPVTDEVSPRLYRVMDRAIYTSNNNLTKECDCMRKAILYKTLFIVSALLILGFAISFGVDAYNYNIFMGSAPLYAYAIVRAVEFIIPSFVAFVIALIIKKNK